MYTRSDLKTFVKKSIKYYYSLTDTNTIEEYHIKDSDNKAFPIYARYFYLKA